MLTDPRSQALSALSRFQVADATVEETLDRIAAITQEAIPVAEMVGMTMLGEDAKPLTAIFTDPSSPEVDEAQYRSGRGPCLDAWRSGTLVLIDDLDDGERAYPEFVAAARAHGVRSTMSLPLVTGDTSMGAMNLYARRVAAFSTTDADLGLDLAGAAASVVANVNAYWTAFELSEQLNQAMSTRSVIEQAKGMLMARSETMTPDEAFDALRRASQRENVKLREIAQRIVDRRTVPGPD